MKPVPHDTIRIERMTEEDLSDVPPLADVIWRACYPGVITVEQIDYMLGWMYAPETLREEVRSQGICYDCLRAGTEMIGFASYGPTDDPGVFKLHKLYLHPEWQGRGLGSTLLKHCETETRKLGARRLVLNVNKRNAHAIAAYRRNAFAITESVTNDIGRGFVMDDYVMSKELSSD